MPKTVELLFVRCVSQARETKWAVCEPVTRFNLLDGCEHSLLFFEDSLKDWTFYLLSVCHLQLQWCTMGCRLQLALTNEKWPWRLFRFWRIKAQLNKKIKVWLFNENGLCVSERPSLWVLVLQQKCCVVLCSRYMLCVCCWLHLNVAFCFFSLNFYFCTNVTPRPVLSLWEMYFSFYYDYDAVSLFCLWHCKENMNKDIILHVVLLWSSLAL